MGLWDGLFTKDGAQDPLPSGAVGRVVGNTATGFGLGSLDSQRDEALLERVGHVFGCVDAIARNAARPPMLVQRDTDDPGPPVEDPLTRKLNRWANTYETAAMFRYRLSTQLLLSRRGAFIEVVRSNAGKVAELHLLPVANVEPIPDSRSYVSGFKVHNAGNQSRVLPPEKVLWIRLRPHPSDPFAQLTPMVANRLAADTDYLARLFNYNFLRNDGKVGQIVAVGGQQLGPDDRRRLEERYAHGPAAAGRTTVVEADALSFVDMAGTPHDMQYDLQLRGSKEDIQLAFGVPETVRGNASGRTFSNAETEVVSFWQHTMQDHCDGVANAFDALTGGGLADDLRVAYDYSTVEPLQRAKQERDKLARDEYQAGLITADEYRDVTGRDPFDVPGSRVIWLTAGKLPVGRDDDDTMAASMLVQAGDGVPVDVQAQARAGAWQGTQDAAAAAAEAGESTNAARAVRLVKALEPAVIDPVEVKTIETSSGDLVTEEKATRGARRLIERQVRAVLRALLRQSARQIIGRFDGTKIRRGTQYWDPPGTRALDVAALVDRDRAARRFTEDVLDALDAHAVAAADDLIGRFRGDRDIDRSEWLTRVRAEIVRPLAASAGDAFTQYLDSMTQAITEADQPDARREHIRAAVTGHTTAKEQAWLPQLAEYLAYTVAEGAEAVAAELLGDTAVKVWHSRGDDAVRPTHAAADGQVAPTRGQFRVGSALLAYPREITGPPEETFGCRCWLTYRRRRVGDPAPVGVLAATG